MANPWEKYGTPASPPSSPSAPSAAGKPWERYAAPPTAAPATPGVRAYEEASRQQARASMSHPNLFEAERRRKVMSLEDPNVDYRTGVPDAKLTAELSLLTKPEQKQLLTERFGAENVDTDTMGRWILKPGAYAKAGIKAPTGANLVTGNVDPITGDPVHGVAVIPKERWTAPRAASFAGEVLPTGGALLGGFAGGVAGMPSGPADILPAMEGAALGGAAGEAGNALIAQALGIAHRTPVEQGRMLAEGAIGGMAGEGAGRVLSRLGRAFPGPYAEFAPLPPEHIATVRKTLDMGLVPRIGAAQPKSFLMPREQGLIEAVFGFGPEKKNVEILQREGQKLVQQTGGAPGAEPREILLATQRKMDDLSRDFDTARNRATQMTDESIQKIQSEMGKAAPLDIQRDLEASYKSFQNEATGLYDRVDALVGNRPVVPTSKVRGAAQGILDQLPKTREGVPLYDPDGVAIKFLRGMTQLPEMYTMRDMQALRSQLASSAEVRSLLASTGARNAEILRQATNDAFDSVSEVLKGRSGKAVEALKNADEFYAKGMNKFDLPIIRKLTLDARQTGYVAPERVLEAVTMPNSATNVARVMELVSPETRGAIRRAHFDSMIQSATDGLTGKVSGMQLAREIKRLKSTFPALYGRDAQSIRNLAEQLAALDGKVDVSALKSGNITTAIKQAIKAEKRFKAVSDDELFSQLSKPGFEPAAAVDHLFRPGHPERIARAVKFFGEDSPEVKNIRALAMTKLMQAMEFTEETRTGVKYGISGKQLEDALKTYGRPTIEAMFGKEQARALYEFASVAEMATAKNPKLSSIAAAAMVLHPVSHVTKLAELFTMGTLMTNPTFIKWMTEGLRYPPGSAKAMNAMTRAMAYRQAIAAEQPGIGGQTLVDKQLEEMRKRIPTDLGGTQNDGSQVPPAPTEGQTS